MAVLEPTTFSFGELLSTLPARHDRECVLWCTLCHRNIARDDRFYLLVMHEECTKRLHPQAWECLDAMLTKGRVTVTPVPV